MSKLPDIWAVDFDGTLCENKFPEIGEPNNRVISYIKNRRKDGDKIILWSCRIGKQLQDAVDWCKDQGLEFDAVNDNLPETVKAFGNNCRKIFANYYLDDRALSLDGLDRVIVNEWIESKRG